MKPIISFIILLANVFTSTLVAAECTTSRNVDISITRPDSLYTDHGDGTVTDNATGLMWQKCSLGQAGSSCTGTALRFTWQAALAVANNNTGSGYTDWRLPSKNELASLVEDACRGPAINETVFPATIGFVYWSSSPYAGNSEVAWMVYFNGGGVATLSKNNNSSFVRLVRVTVTAAVPAVPTGLSPGSTNSPGSTLGGSTVTVSWNASSGASLYIGDVRDFSSGNSVGTINTGSTSATFSLSPGKSYRWWVEACSSTGCSSQSAFVYFQTQADPAPTACTDPYEPNDSSGAAFPSGNYQLTKNYIYSAKICTATDVDWFKIYAATAGTISLTLAVPSGKDYDMELYTSSWVANGTNYGPGITDTLTFGATAGTWYYIRVLGYGDAFDLTASYSLSGTWP